MASETGPSAAAADRKPPPADQPKDHPQPRPKSLQPPPAAAAAAAAAAAKLSNAELKKRAKEEKAARRAAAKAAQPPAAHDAKASPAAAKAKAKPDGLAASPPSQQQQQQQHHHLHSHHRAASKSALPPSAAVDARPKLPECFGHLSVARRIPIAQADKDVHPAVLALGQQMAAFAVADSTSRLEATLVALKKVVADYTTPMGATLSRHLTSHVLNPQIEYLAACRPMCFSMGNAVRWLKLQVSRIDIDMPDADAKRLLCESMDAFIRERVTLAGMVIARTAADMVADGDVVLVYAHHHLVERALVDAARRRDADGAFGVIVVDDPFERVGLAHAKRLAAAGIPVTYASDLGALRTSLNQATLVVTAAEAMFSNGAMYARSGTCDVAAVASDLGLRVVALCETINFTERVSIDSLTYNEVHPDSSDARDGVRLLFDTTRDKHLSVVVTELGNTSAKSVPAILRKLEEL